MSPHLQAIVGALWAAALSTLGDWIWARFIPAHRPVFGLAHGTLLCLGIGSVIAMPRLSVKGPNGLWLRPTRTW